MYVCICKGITEKQLIEATIGRSHQSSKDVLKSLGVGSDCGTCIEDALSKIKSKYYHQNTTSGTIQKSHTKQN